MILVGDVLHKTIFALLLHISTPTTTTIDIQSLLWPLPQKIIDQDERVQVLLPERFYFTTATSSEILRQAFQRYMNIIFHTPVPFYPSEAPSDVQEIMQTLEVSVNDDHANLNVDTDESCKYL